MDAFPFARPLYVMAKPAGAHCNLACHYCYYLEKKKLYADAPQHVMSDELLEHFVREYLAAQTQPEVLFTWHGGEALMRPLSFYQKAVELQRRYAGGRRIDNALQTNGTLLTDEWCRFFRDQGWLVGVSLDGPQEYHDAYRKSRLGRPSWREVMRGIELLNKYGVEWNALAVVNDFNGDHPLDFYRFFRDIGCRYLQFTPVVERFLPRGAPGRLAGLSDTAATLADFSVRPAQWGTFLCAVFDEWVRHDVGELFVQLFDATLANWMGVEPGVCVYGKTCSHAMAMEFNGDVYSCDHFVFPQYRLGNIREQSLASMAYGEQQQAFGRLKMQLPTVCRECRFGFACNGECPRNRFAVSETGEAGLNYLCRGYYRFFEHAAPYMDFMKRQLQRELPPAAIVEYLKSHEL